MYALTMANHTNPNGAIIDRAQTVGADGLTDEERQRMQASFLRAPSPASRSHLAAWRERSRAA